jgi:hypothetical protein
MVQQCAAARTLCPSESVVTSPRDAAQRILAQTTDEAVWREAESRATKHVLRTWDWSLVQRDYDRMLVAR